MSFLFVIAMFNIDKKNRLKAGALLSFQTLLLQTSLLQTSLLTLLIAKGLKAHRVNR